MKSCFERKNILKKNMDKYLKQFKATNYKNCIIKEELIISDDVEHNDVDVDVDDEENDDVDVDVETVDESIDEKFLVDEINVVNDGSNEISKDQVKRNGNGRHRNKNDKQMTLDSFFKAKNSASNEQFKNPKNINVETPRTDVKIAASDNMDALYKKFAKSHCQQCNVKRAVVRQKARCPKCKTQLTYSCETCNKNYGNFTDLGYHLKNQHDSPKNTADRQVHACPVCHKTFSSRNAMQVHRKTQHVSGEESSSKQQNVYACDKCTFTAKYKSNLTNHVSEKHTDFKKECENCNKTFTNPRSIKRHLKVYCNREKRFECHHCVHKFYRRDQVLKHLDEVHFKGTLTNKKPRDDSQTARICKYCDKALERYEHMRFHLDRCESAPSNRRPDSGTADQPDLESALANLSRTHCENCNVKRQVKKRQRRCKKCEILLKFTCVRCSKSYSSSQRLADHLLANHVMNKAFYRCNECSRSYFHLKNLKLHEKTHHPSKSSYECSKCGKSYNNPGSFRKHRVSCVEEPKFGCDKCSYKTHFKSTLVEHFRAKRTTCC